jgi:putative membrane protein
MPGHDVDSTDELIGGSASTELSSNRTAMSFARSEMSGDRTLMSVIRTALSLIGFGFTIYQFFTSMQPQLAPGKLPPEAPLRFGLSLIVLGVLLLILGIIGHWRVIHAFRTRRSRLHALGLIRHEPEHRISAVWLVALLLLLIGITAILRIAFGIGPF